LKLNCKLSQFTNRETPIGVNYCPPGKIYEINLSGLLKEEIEFRKIKLNPPFIGLLKP